MLVVTQPPTAAMSPAQAEQFRCSVIVKKPVLTLSDQDKSDAVALSNTLGIQKILLGAWGDDCVDRNSRLIAIVTAVPGAKITPATH